MELRSVIARLQALSKRLLWRILLTGGPRLAATASGLAGGTFLLDYTLRLPVGVRAVLLLLSLGLLGFVVVRHLAKPLMKKPSVDQLALMAEAANPDLKDQLISSIQLERDLETGRAVESPELIRATIADTAKQFGSRSFASSVSLAACRKPLILASVAVMFISGLAVSRPTEFGLWVQRQLLLQDTPWPRANTLVVTILDMQKYRPTVHDDGRRIVLHVPERTPLQVQVSEKNGKLPDEVELVTRPASDLDVEQRISMGRSQKNAFFQHIFPPLMRSIVFHAEGGDDDDGFPVYEIQVDQAPRVTRFWAAYDYPEYTGVQDRSLPDANISAPEGTRITMHFEVNMDLAEFALEFESVGEMKMPQRKAGENAYRYSFVVEGNDFYTHRLIGDNQVASADVPRYVITSEVDQAPRVTVEMPTSTGLFVTPNATIPLKGTAIDDYGVTEVGLRWGEDSKKLESGAIAFAGDDLIGAEIGARQIPFFHALDVKDFVLPARAEKDGSPAREARPMQVGDRFSFRYLAADNRRTASQPEPHRTFGDYEYQVQVLSTEELQRELAQRQVRLRDRILDISNLIDTRITDTQELVSDLNGGTDATVLQSRFWSIEQDQNRITIELQASARQFLRVYDGYLWNRLDEGALTEKMISQLLTAHRSGETDDSFKIYGDAVRQVGPLVDEAQIMGRLTVILKLLILTSAEQSPEARRRLSRASLVTTKEDRLEYLRGALEVQKLLRDNVLLLIEKLEAWEDYLDLIQGFKDLLELQKGVHDSIEKLTKKK
ncbi:MAG: hypothetical protein CL908_17750 [Deltaproteobacteria bacterium]|nr:hypothetical protein [Deltaproteobacteria bacterium]